MRCSSTLIFVCTFIFSDVPYVSAQKNDSVQESGGLTPNVSTSPSNDFVPFHRIHVGQYTFSGEYDVDSEYAIDAEEIPTALGPDGKVREYLANRPPNERAPRGNQVVFYTGFDGQLRITLEWVMSGAALTYAEIDQALEVLRGTLLSHSWLSKHPLDMDISFQGRIKIHFNVDNEEGELVNIARGQYLWFVGKFFPHRPTPLNVIRQQLTAIAADIESEENPRDHVPNDWGRHEEEDGVLTNINITPILPGEQLPTINFRQVTRLVNAINEFYRSRNLGAQLHGGIRVAGYEDEFGFMEILPDFRNQKPTLTETPVIEGNFTKGNGNKTMRVPISGVKPGGL